MKIVNKKPTAVNITMHMPAAFPAKPPKVKLKEGVIYSGDNGRLFCRKCAGWTALYTGRDLSGQKVEAVDVSENAEWKKEFGKDMACERGCTKYVDAVTMPLGVMHTGPMDLVMTSPPVKGAPAAKWWPDLFLRKGRKLYPITPEQCGPVRDRYNAGRGASEIKEDLYLHDSDGKRIGHISYNGRPWLHDIEGNVEIPVAGIKTVKERDVEGWK